MDGYEATRIVFSRIQRLDPENASKIMGLLLIQDHGEKEMIRLAFGPESLVQSVIFKAKKELGLSSSPTKPNPSRLGVSIPNPSWSDLPNPEDLVSPSNGGGASGSSLNPASLPFYGNGGGVCDSLSVDDFTLQDQLSFLNDNNPSPSFASKSCDLGFSQLDSLPSPTSAGSGVDPALLNSYWTGGVHRRSCSVSDVLGAEDANSGFGWRPCLYFARGFCKNGSNCRFVHGGLGESDGSSLVGSPSKVEMMEQCHELLRSKSAHQQRLAAVSQLLGSGSGSGFPYSPKSLNFLLQQDSQRAAAVAAAMRMGEDMAKFGRSRLDRNELVNPASRQIYLTFPADSTFREEDVSNYFSIYGPVQDVRIPYQQKRMFGFVTFVYPETVKIILAKGNPHFVCDARVLVKPYKEKGKVPDKKQQPQLERGEFSPCGTPTGFDSRDPFDLGARVFYNNQDMMWRRKLEEQTDLQQALELQSRRLMNLQLLDVKKHHHHRALSTGSPIPSPTHSPSLFSQSMVFPPLHSGVEALHDNCSSPLPVVSLSTPRNKHHAGVVSEKGFSSNEGNGSKESSLVEDNDFLESLEHHLPDSPFASPAKGSGKFLSAFSNIATEAAQDSSAAPPSSTNNGLTTPAIVPTNSSLDMASFNCQLPRFSSGPGSIGMYTGTGGPTCPVGI